MGDAKGSGVWLGKPLSSVQTRILAQESETFFKSCTPLARAAGGGAGWKDFVTLTNTCLDGVNILKAKIEEFFALSPTVGISSNQLGAINHKIKRPIAHKWPHFCSAFINAMSACDLALAIVTQKIWYDIWGPLCAECKRYHLQEDTRRRYWTALVNHVLDFSKGCKRLKLKKLLTLLNKEDSWDMLTFFMFPSSQSILEFNWKN